MNEKLLREAIESLQIQDVYLRECSIKQLSTFDPKLPEFEQLNVQSLHRPGHVQIKEIEENNTNNKFRILKAYFETSLKLLPPGVDANKIIDENQMSNESENPLVDVRAVFIADYLMVKEISQEAIKEFSIMNVGYHVWPYWRELIQSIAARLRLPPVIVPFYTVPTINSNEDDKK